MEWTTDLGALANPMSLTPDTMPSIRTARECGPEVETTLTTNLSDPAAVELLGAPDLRLVETAPPELTDAQKTAMNGKWEEMTTANPALFDGPVAVCTGVEWTDPGTMVLSWCRATYRLLALRLDPDHAVPAPSLFVSVAQPTNDGHLLVGRMAASTVSSGRWQLPGGTIEPPTDGNGLDADALAGHAARELAEEIGLDVARCDLELWTVTRGNWGNIGIHFRAPARPTDTLKDAYAALASSEIERGRVPELDKIDFIRSESDVAGLGGPAADFLPVLATLYSGAHAAGRPGCGR